MAGRMVKMRGKPESVLELTDEQLENISYDDLDKDRQ